MTKFRKVGYVVLLAIGILGIADTLAVLAVSGVNVGVVLPGIIGVFLVIIAGGQLLYNRNPLRVRNPLMRRGLLVIFILWLCSFVVIEANILAAQKSEETQKADYLLILGGGLNGSELSLTLLSRMESGLEYLRLHPNMLVVVSGGQGFGEDIPEAEAMQRYLVAHGIPQNRIIKEEKSTSTWENFRFSKQAVDRLDEGRHEKVMVVTSDFHMFRTKLLAKRAGMEAYGLPCRTPLNVRLNCYVREYFAVVKSLAFDR